MVRLLFVLLLQSWSWPGSSIADLRAHLGSDPHFHSAAELAGKSGRELIRLHDEEHDRHAKITGDWSPYQPGSGVAFYGRQDTTPPAPKGATFDLKVLDRLQKVEELLGGVVEQRELIGAIGPALEVIRQELSDAREARLKPFDYSPIRGIVTELIGEYERRIDGLGVTQRENHQAVIGSLMSLGDRLTKLDELSRKLSELSEGRERDGILQAIRERHDELVGRLEVLGGMFSEIRAGRAEIAELKAEFNRFGGFGGVLSEIGSARAAVIEAKAELIKAQAELEKANTEARSINGSLGSRFFWFTVYLIGGVGVLAVGGSLILLFVYSRLKGLIGLIPGAPKL